MSYCSTKRRITYVQVVCNVKEARFPFARPLKRIQTVRCHFYKRLGKYEVIHCDWKQTVVAGRRGWRQVWRKAWSKCTRKLVEGWHLLLFCVMAFAWIYIYAKAYQIVYFKNVQFIVCPLDFSKSGKQQQQTMHLAVGRQWSWPQKALTPRPWISLGLSPCFRSTDGLLSLRLACLCEGTRTCSAF